MNNEVKNNQDLEKQVAEILEENTVLTDPKHFNNFKIRLRFYFTVFSIFIILMAVALLYFFLYKNNS
ncbi:hypothetical protein CO229_02240 [Mycoplasmopsis bovirhinis]|uniref:hypothetical protein n=1 Tax=Mycoplasmopsis bovirhinis TaxID=29553 RepID=UPI000C058EC7|nr:hypothetical protein [Mycoplasmopsis bovirhinis]ATO30923.1 hypothetical protein CO229_02240 [Mycoplasmopsis bovirhinis]